MTNYQTKKPITGAEHLAQLLKSGKIIKGSIFLVEYLKRQNAARRGMERLARKTKPSLS